MPEPSALAGDFIWEQVVTVQFRSAQRTFRVVLQKQGGTLDVLGLTPFGTRAFLVQQRGANVEVSSYGGPPLPFEPRAMLLDIHRTFLLEAPPRPPHDGQRTYAWRDELVIETWRSGRLMVREFQRRQAPVGTLTVLYEGGMQNRVPPRRVQLQSGWYGYELEIETETTRDLGARR